MHAIKTFFSSLMIFALLAFPILAQQKGPEQKEHQVVILGSGVGGLTAAVYFARGGYDTCLIEGETPGGLITKSPLVENWPGERGIKGTLLAEKIFDQAYSLGCSFLKEKVVAVDFSKRPFAITAQDLIDKKKSRTYLAEVCVIAMGSEVKMLGLENENNLLGKGISSCAICDGALYKDKVVAVAGGSDSALAEADHLSKFASKVYLLVRGKAIKAKDQLMKKRVLNDPKIELFYDTEIVKLDGEKKLCGLALKSKGRVRELSLDGLFLSLGYSPNTEIFKGKLKLDRNGYIVTSKFNESSIKGVFAIGDIANGPSKQAVNAASNAAIAFSKAQKQLLAEESASPKKESSPISEIKDQKSFETALASSDGFILVDFYASWCPPCKLASKAIDSSYDEISSKIQIYKLNVEEAPELARSFEIYSLPSFLVIDKNGRAVARKSGYDEVLKLLDQIKSSENFFKDLDKEKAPVR